MLYVLILNCLFSKYYNTCFSIVNRFSAFILKKNVPRHILAPSAVACDILHLRASAHSAGGFYRIGDEVSYTIKKPCVYTYHTASPIAATAAIRSVQRIIHTHPCRPILPLRIHAPI